MPSRHFVQTITPLFELARSDDTVNFANNTSIITNLVDTRDIASVGVQDFNPLSSIPPAQVWRIGWSFGIYTIVGTVNSYLGLYVYLQTQFRISGGAYVTFGGTPQYLPPTPAAAPFHGEYKIQSDGAKLVFYNSTGATLRVNYSVWAKGD